MAPSRKHSLEKMVDEFAKSHDPTALLRVLGATELSNDVVEHLGRLLIRSSIILTRPDAARQKRRDIGLQAIVDRAAERLGRKGKQALACQIEKIAIIERGYALLSNRLDQLLEGTDPVRWFWATLSLVAEQVDWALEEIDLQTSRSPIVDGWSFTLPDGQGGRYRADELIAMFDATTSMTLRAYAAKWGWIRRDGAIIAPQRVAVTEVETDAALRVQKLAEAWEAWRRIDDEVRFFGGTIAEVQNEVGVTVMRHTPDKEGLRWRKLALAAHEQLTAEIASIFNQLVYREDAHHGASGIDGTVPLYPHAFVNIGELQGAQALEISLSRSPDNDTTLYAGLRLTEWIRGYSVLTALAERVSRNNGGPDRLIIELKPGELLALLGRLGLGMQKAQAFLKMVTFSRHSRDFVDEPLIATTSDKLLLFGPTILNGEVARILLSKLSREGVSFERRGTRFEREMRRRFVGWGLEVHSFTLSHRGQIHEFDMLVPWDGYLFVFECKSRSPIGIDPARSWQARQHLLDACSQVSRLCECLRQQPEMLRSKIGAGADSFILVPCVLNALPLQSPGTINDVYVTDLAAVGTFFEMGEVGAYATHRLPGLPPLRQRLHVVSLWAGPTPSADDFLRFLKETPTLRIMDAHLELVPSIVDIDGSHRIETVELGRLPDSVATVADVLEANGGGAVW